jgi:hypothetical protein
MEYIAKTRGYRRGAIVEVGEKFESEDFKGKWAVPVEGASQPPKADESNDEPTDEPSGAAPGLVPAPEKKKAGRPKKVVENDEKKP